MTVMLSHKVKRTLEDVGRFRTPREANRSRHGQGYETETLS